MVKDSDVNHCKSIIWSRADQFARQEQQALNDQREKHIREEKFRKLQQKVEHAQNMVSRQSPHEAQMLKKKMHAVKAMEHRYERENANMTEMPEEESAIFFKLGDKSAAIPAGKTVVEYTLDCLYTSDEE